jgi:hydrogenase small subunit
MLKDLTLNPLVASARVLDSLACSVESVVAAFVQFCSSLIIAVPFGVAITDKKTPEDVPSGLGKVKSSASDLAGLSRLQRCTETLLRASHPDLGDLINERHLAGISRNADGRLGPAGARSSCGCREEIFRQYICVVEGPIPIGDKGVYMKLAGRPAMGCSPM